MIQNSSYSKLSIIETKGNIINNKIKVNNKGLESYGSLISAKTSEFNFGGGVYDLYNRVVGINVSNIKSYEQNQINGFSYMININEALIIASKIKKEGNYTPSSFPFSTINLENIDISDREYYGVSDNVYKGVMVYTFSAFNYIFNNIKIGMVIVSINGVKIENQYDVFSQLIRYNNDCKVDVGVIKNDGSLAYYLVKI